MAVAVHGNKGGVGKSLVAANLALELKARGVRVGILDADLDSPYLAEMVRAKGKVGLRQDDRRMVPVMHEGLPIMSFALWTPDEFGGASMSGEVHDRWIRDALMHTDWGQVEVLIADLPAGTGDEYLALKGALGDRLLGIIAVAQPNVVSGLKRVYHTASFHHIRILGVVENMAGAVFGTGEVQAFCKETGLLFLGSIPLDARIAAGNRRGDARLPEDLAAPILAAANRLEPALASVRAVVS